MRPSSALFGAALTLLSSVLARSSTGDRVLVVLEPSISRDDYSKFWESLKGRGFDLTFKGPKDQTAELIRYGETVYDHLIMFAPTTKSFVNSLSPKAVIEAQFAGVNTLHLLSSNISEIHRDTFREYDLEFVDSGSAYLDAFSHVHGETASTAVVSSQRSLVDNGAILSSKDDMNNYGGAIVYPSGSVHVTGKNPYLIDILHGSTTAYIGKEGAIEGTEAEVEAAASIASKAAITAGKKAALISAIQTRDNVRVGFVGSGAMFSDKWWDAEVMRSKTSGTISNNALLAEDLTKWLFQETGVVKVVATHHHRAGETTPREHYTKKNQLTYTITLSQHTTTANGTSAWTAFDASDLQLDFTMLDPHIRTALVKDEAASTDLATTYKAQFKAPDRHGVFKFVVEYWRPGWSYVRSSETASVVPLRHDEYEKFIMGSWPYYASTLSVSAAFMIFCTIWLALGDEDKKGKKKSE